MMGPLAKEGGDRGGGRRKSINIFSRTSLSGLAHLNTSVTPHGEEVGEKGEKGEKKERKKLGKRGSIFGLGPASSPNILEEGSKSPTNIGKGSPKLRPRMLTKGRPTSVFGSLGKRSVSSMGDLDIDKQAGSPDSSPDREPKSHSSGSFSKVVLYSGEIQSNTGMFRKKKEYLVLTETHLIRFKSQSRACEIFPSIQIPNGRSTARHPSTTSISSLQDVQSSHASSESEARIPLGQIVTVYKVADGRPYFTVEVVYMDEENHGCGSIQLLLHDPNESDLWNTSIRGAAQKARLQVPVPYPQRIVEYLALILEGEMDYDPDHFQLFRVARRTVETKDGKSPSDDLQRLGSSVFYMVIGLNKVHLIPPPDLIESSGRLSSKAGRSSYGIVALDYLQVADNDDRFQVVFKTPLESVKMLDLAAAAPPDLATALINAWQWLKPQWDELNFQIIAPKHFLEAFDLRKRYCEDDFGGFDRTLVAYCIAYNCNPSKVVYSIDFEVEDAPEFRLCAPAFGGKYNSFELLAITRALRYNESFRSISFRDVDLHSLHGIYETFGTEHVAWSTRGGISIEKYFGLKPKERTLLYQEVQALALKNMKVNRMDFTNCLPRRRPRDTFDLEGGDITKDPGCEIVAGLLPLCQKQITNVTWVILNGIELGETDLDYLIPALQVPNARIRAVECGKCGLNDRGIMLLVNNLERQNATIEVINISDNPGRISLEQFQASMSRFTKLRRLNLARTTYTTGDQTLFLPEVLLTWHLEELVLNGVQINENTLDAIATYLNSGASDSLRILQMDQCNLHGDQAAFLMHSMTRKPGEVRELEFHINGNRLEKGVSEIVKAIEENKTPTHLYLRMIEYTKEDYFRNLLQALRTNSTIRCLDLSKASLPYDAGPETCDAMKEVFANNKTLEELDISGEQAHLEVTRFGIGLNHALTGLKENDTLKVLRIEYQNLGLEGANTLASVLEANKGLTHVYCEHNDINLQGFTTLINALAKNFSVLVLPYMKDDQTATMKRMNDQVRDNRRLADTAQNDHHVKNSVRRTLKLGASKANKKEPTQQDVVDVVKVLCDRWDFEKKRLATFLQRNNNLAFGAPNSVGDGEETITEEMALRPSTALSENGIMEHVLSNTTPKIELSDPVDDHIYEKMAGLGISGVGNGRENEVALSENELEVKAGDGGGEKEEGPKSVLQRNYLNDVDVPTLGDIKLFDLDADNPMFRMD